MIKTVNLFRRQNVPNGQRQYKIRQSLYPLTQPLIAFASEGKAGQEQGIYVVDMAGNLRRVCEHGFEDIWVSWSPDGSKIAFPVQNESYDIFIYSSDISGNQLKQLTGNEKSDKKFEDLHPVWSPDGKRIAFCRKQGLWVMDADGKNQKMLAEKADLYKYPPKWNPAGTKIAFNSDDDEIIVIDADGKSPLKTGKGYNPSWCPDGKKIVFTSSEAQEEYICSMDADGKNREKLTDGYYPVWSPDGKMIVFKREDFIFTMKPDGTSQKKISEKDGNRFAWSPDGSKIAFIFKWEIDIMEADGNDLKKLSDYYGDDGGLAWSPTWLKDIAPLFADTATKDK